MASNFKNRQNGPKIAKISTQTKLAWPKYDTELQGYLSDNVKLQHLIKDSFTAAGLENDFDELTQQQNLGELVREHLANTDAERLGQKNVRAILKDMYYFVEDEEEDNRAPVPTAGRKANDYQDYFLRMKEMGADKKWTDAQLADALKNRTHGEKMYDAWLNQHKRATKKDSAVVLSLQADAEKRQLNKKKVEKEKVALEELEARKLANKPKEKVLNERRQRTTDEFLNDQALWEHKKMSDLQNAIIQKEQHAQEEDQLHGYTPKLNKKSTKMAEEMHLGDQVEARLGKKTYRDNRFVVGRRSY